eukprot:00588.XXX_303_425_1 [CDS] Oithona nana genome sequencing.
MTYFLLLINSRNEYFFLILMRFVPYFSEKYSFFCSGFSSS